MRRQSRLDSQHRLVNSAARHGLVVGRPVQGPDGRMALQPIQPEYHGMFLDGRGENRRLMGGMSSRGGMGSMMRGMPGRGGMMGGSMGGMMRGSMGDMVGGMPGGMPSGFRGGFGSRGGGMSFGEGPPRTTPGRGRGFRGMRGGGYEEHADDPPFEGPFNDDRFPPDDFDTNKLIQI